MDLAIPDPYGLTASDALSIASERELWPASMGAREIQETLPAAIRDRAVFSARTTNARYLQAVKDRVERYLAGGYKGDKATLRVELKAELARLGYSPERGFPGDEALGIPPPEPVSGRDVCSSQRSNLILAPQLRLMTGRAQRAAGLDPLALERYPAWELIRTEDRVKKRQWLRRWVEAGGQLYGANKDRMIALKQAEVWDILGDPTFFHDALGVDHPPFAYNSGMGWRQIDEEECLELGVLEAPLPIPAQPPTTALDLLPDAVASTDGLDDGILKKIAASQSKLSTRPRR